MNFCQTWAGLSILLCCLCPKLVWGSAGKSYVYFTSQWCYGGYTKNLPHLNTNGYKNDATYYTYSYSSDIRANCSLKTSEDVIFSIQSLGAFSKDFLMLQAPNKPDRHLH